MDHQRDLDSGEMQLEHAGILECKLAQGVLYGIRLCGLPMRAVRFVSFVDKRPVRLVYKPYFFSQRTIFFSHNKSANGTFSYGLSAKRTGQ